MTRTACPSKGWITATCCAVQSLRCLGAGRGYGRLATASHVTSWTPPGMSVRFLSRLVGVSPPSPEGPHVFPSLVKVLCFGVGFAQSGATAVAAVPSPDGAGAGAVWGDVGAGSPPHRPREIPPKHQPPPPSPRPTAE